MKRGGWYGNSAGHALAAKGIKVYNKSKLVDPVFFARKNEKQLPFSHIMSMARQDKSFQDMKRMHPNVDEEDLRLRGIKAYTMIDADDTLDKINKIGVDMLVKMADNNQLFKKRMMKQLSTTNTASFINEEKREALKRNLI